MKVFRLTKTKAPVTKTLKKAETTVPAFFLLPHKKTDPFHLERTCFVKRLPWMPAQMQSVICKWHADTPACNILSYSRGVHHTH